MLLLNRIHTIICYGLLTILHFHTLYFVQIELYNFITHFFTGTLYLIYSELNLAYFYCQIFAFQLTRSALNSKIDQELKKNWKNLFLLSVKNVLQNVVNISERKQMCASSQVVITLFQLLKTRLCISSCFVSFFSVII